jgi:hypothetical protein
MNTMQIELQLQLNKLILILINYVLFNDVFMNFLIMLRHWFLVMNWEIYRRNWL